MSEREKAALENLNTVIEKLDAGQKETLLHVAQGMAIQADLSASKTAEAEK